MRTDTILLPSRLQLEMRGTGLAEENILATANHRNEDEIQARVLERCCVRVLDPGIYAIPEGGRPPWGELLQCDQLVLLIRLRCLSYLDGAEYEIDNIQCPGCSRPVSWKVDIIKDLPVRAFPDDMIDLLKRKDPVETMIAGRRVKFKIPTSRDMRLAERLQDEFPERVMAANLRARLVDVEGVDRREWMDWLDGNNGTSSKFAGLSSEESEALRDAYDAADGGIDTDVEITCQRPACKRRFTIALPFDQGFLLPNKGIRARKRARRLGQDSSEG